MDQIKVMETCLASFCGMSGQRVSLEKSCLCVSKNIIPMITRALSIRCGIPLTSCFGKYLGVSLIDKRMTKNTFAEFIGNVQSKLTGWKASNLSLAGRATLVQSITSAIPNHIM